MLPKLQSGSYFNYSALIILLLLSLFIIPCTQAEQQHNNTLRQNNTYAANDKIRERYLDQRIVGGELAAVGEFPSFIFSGCGGTLIHPDIVLTAAHCTSGNSKKYLINIGGIKRNGSDSERIFVIKEIPHPLYDETTYRNDLMILVLANSSSKPLQKLNPNNNIPAINEVVTAIGFGRLSYNGPRYFGDLRKVNVNIVSYRSCKLANLLYPIYNNSMVCAGVRGGGKDTCQGDSGGPLLTSSGVQVGITSYGAGCGRRGRPAIYTRISTYYNWIQRTICNYSSVPSPDCSNVPPTDPTLTFCPCLPAFLWLCRLILGCT